ncbi:uncharacterized protein Z520_08258 [Fonsecaea multimorphosa CBS 102226]|uniref:Enoyl reductase (ER) domain-containing protein n=1 Tax=Fonsecaea multimorphosa CBS 102226 TaxID=1442371 RepID=A0A0D2KH77_9EURO|nr:uncharacterized protein Z520_08258 [Fonsecaea multimorphosa CBS 102226]KIX96003.1 hypothetical protein Z520_08258 [Fonsecaea multimorphosa CBS 102226]
MQEARLTSKADWKHAKFISDKGATLGCDYAGTVLEIGPDVQASVEVGDRIAGWVHGGNVGKHEDGCFAEYAMARDGIFAKIPDNMSFEEACTLGIGKHVQVKLRPRMLTSFACVSTVGLAMYQTFDIPWPEEPAKESTFILINGGSSATGTLAIQFAKLSGLEVVATASPQNFRLLRSLGADHVFDYNSTSCVKDIQALTGDSLQYCLDCVSSEESMKLCSAALSSRLPGYYSSLLGRVQFPRKGVQTSAIMAYTIFGEEYTKMNVTTPASPDDWQFGVEFWALAQDLLERGKFKPHPFQVGEGGLDGILQGCVSCRQFSTVIETDKF